MKGDTPGGFVIGFDRPEVSRSATIDADVLLNLNGQTYALGDDGDGVLTVGSTEGSDRGLLLRGGTLDAGDVSVGAAPGPLATVTVLPGIDPALLDADLLTVGVADSAAVVVESGGTVTLRSGLWVGAAPGVAGEVEVRGRLQVTDPVLGTLIGDAGIGALSVIEAGVLSLVGPVEVGSGAASNGLLALADGSQGTTLGSLRVGGAGVGGLEVTGEASLVSQDAALGVEPGSLGTALVDGPGSRWPSRSARRP